MKYALAVIAFMAAPFAFRAVQGIWCLARHYPSWSHTRHGDMRETFCPHCNTTWWEPR